MNVSTKRLLSVLLSLAMVLAMLPVASFAATPSTLYMQPSDNWNQGGARFAAYFFGNGDTWVSMTDSDGDGIYEVAVPDGYPSVIFCRMNPGAAANNWGNKWNQTADLTVPTDGTNCYVIAPNTWDNGKGQWISFTPGGEIVTEPTEPAPVMFTVAGASGLCGSNWTPEDVNNKMSDEDGDGIYTITYTGVAAGSYEFKVTNGTWDESWGKDGGASNYELTVAEDNSTVTINFDAASHQITVVINDDAVVEEPVAKGYYVAGDFTNWKENDAAYLMNALENGTYTLTFAVAAGSHKLKVTDGTWANAWPGVDYEFTASADGDVTVTFNPADGAVYVTGENLGTEPEVPADPVEKFYTVAGSDALCGTGWDPTNEANKLTDEDGDGIYTITYTNVAAGSYEFKVTDGTWDHAWPGENYVLNVEQDTDVTITFNSADQSVNVTFGYQDVPAEKVYIVAGSDALCGTGWDPTNEANKLTDEDGDGIFTITYTNVAAGSYEFKVTNGTWDQAWPGDNYVLNVPETTDVTISFNPADGTIGVTLGSETAPVYILAGQDTLCGSNWDPSDVNNKLTDADGDGIFTITYTDLAAADYMFKVTNGTWDQCWGGDGADGNYVFRLWAKSNVTISFNPETGIITLDIEELEAPTEPPIPDVPSTVYYVAGDMNGWTNPDAAYTMNDQGDGIYTLTFSVTAGDYGLKVTDGTWTNCWPGDNYNFKAYTDGEVTVTFNTGDYSVSVTGECLNEPAPEPMTITSMHVAGSEGLCGVQWDPTLNQMDVAMGVYSITFTDVAAGTYEFKFVANAAWGMEWASGVEMPSGETQTAWFMPMGNSSVVVAEDGSTVTLTFDMTTMDIITGEGATCSALVEAPVAPEEPTSAFQVGDQIIIYALETDVALSTTQNKNNRGQAAIVKNEGTISFGEDVQVITLVEGTVPGTFGFQVGEGQYLYAASSSSNHLKTTDTLDDNASWSIVIDETTGEATITASGENTRNLLRYNKASSIFSCYGSGQQAVAVYKITGEEPEPPVVKDLELELGDNTLILDAGDRDGDTWTFEVTEVGTLTINPVAMMADNGMGQLEAVPAEYVSMVLARQFALQINGVAVFEYPTELTVVEGDTIELFFCSNMAAPAELTLNLTLTPPVVEEPETQTATLVTDVNSLKAGDQIIIVAQDYDKAMSAELKNNNRDAIDITKDGNTVAFTDAVQVITLVEGTVASTFGFQVGEGQYLYAASSKSNYLKLTETLDDNGSFAITVDENGELSVVASGSSTRNILRYNSGSDLFSCYGSGQAAICIYTLGGTTEEPDSNELVLGDNALTLDAGDWDGNTWTFVATEEGALKLDVTAMMTEDMGVMQEVPSEYLSMVISRQYGIYVNDIFFDIFNQTWPVSAGDVVSIRISSNMANATELTLNLSIGEAEIVEPGGPGSFDDPIVIDSMPYEVTVEGTHDIYYTYVAEKDGVLVFTAEEGNLVSLVDSEYEKVGNKYYVTVTAGDAISINPWGEASGTYTMAYYVAEEVSLKCESITVSFKEEFLMNIYFNGTNLDAVLEMGMLTYSSKVDNFSVFNAENVYCAEYNEANSMYRVTTNGIAAKNMGDTVWMVLYAKLADGSYYYTDMAGYSPAQYAYTLLKEGNPTTQRLMVAMLNYGAAAQTYFGYNTDNLVNKDVTEVEQTMISGYNSDMVSKADAVPAEKQGAFTGNGGFADLAVTVSFKGTFVINYYGKATAAIADTVTLYYWDEATYQSNEVLTAENASGSVDMILNDNGQYVGSLSGFVARKLNTPVYIAMVYSDGTTTQSSGVLPYSVGQYCSSFAGTQDAFAPMAEATAIYGFYAKQYFG